MSRSDGWLARIHHLGTAFLAVLKAELAAALADLARSGQGLVRAAVLFTVTVALGFWTVGLLVYFLVEMLALWLPRWGAVGIVFGLFLAATAIFAWAAVARARRIETPAAILDRRLRDHKSWWQDRIGGGAEDEREGDPDLEGGDEWRE